MDNEQNFTEILFKCRKCGQEKLLNRENFNVSSLNSNGYTNWCKNCKKSANQKRYLEKKQIIIYNVRKWQKNNKDKILNYRKKWHSKKDKKIREVSLNQINNN